MPSNVFSIRVLLLKKVPCKFILLFIAIFSSYWLTGYIYYTTRSYTLANVLISVELPNFFFFEEISICCTFNSSEANFGLIIFQILQKERQTLVSMYSLFQCLSLAYWVQSQLGLGSFLLQNFDWTLREQSSCSWKIIKQMIYKKHLQFTPLERHWTWQVPRKSMGKE